MFNNTHSPQAKKFWYMGKLYEWNHPIIYLSRSKEGLESLRKKLSFKKVDIHGNQA